jgi:hypothetical protein
LSRSADFLWDAIGLGYTLDMAAERQGTAIYARRWAKINDRAHVLAGATGARVVAAGTYELRLGPDTFTGDLLARGPITLSDRSRAGSVTSSNRVYEGNSVTHGLILQVEPMRFEDFDLQIPWAAPPRDQRFREIRNDRTEDLTPGPSIPVVVRSRATLRVQPGVHVLRWLNVEPGARLVVSGPTWIYITGSTVVGDGYTIAYFNGDILGNASNLFVGVPSGENVILGAEWRGTLVAPQAYVWASPYTNATLAGSFFSYDFELFEGRWLYYVPFSRPWVPTCTGADGFTNCS